MIAISQVTAFYAQKFGEIIIIVFTAFSFVGTFLEWAIGYLYHQFMGKKLWTYHEKTVGGYTSILSIPLWGYAGILFWLLASVFN